MTVKTEEFARKRFNQTVVDLDPVMSATATREHFRFLTVLQYGNQIQSLTNVLQGELDFDRKKYDIVTDKTHTNVHTVARFDGTPTLLSVRRNVDTTLVVGSQPLQSSPHRIEYNIRNAEDNNSYGRARFFNSESIDHVRIVERIIDSLQEEVVKRTGNAIAKTLRFIHDPKKETGYLEDDLANLVDSIWQATKNFPRAMEGSHFVLGNKEDKDDILRVLRQNGLTGRLGTMGSLRRNIPLKDGFSVSTNKSNGIEYYELLFL